MKYPIVLDIDKARGEYDVWRDGLNGTNLPRRKSEIIKYVLYFATVAAVWLG